ncbi:MAG TPA: hypothetical protein VGF59_03475 [Bryobacteraceae bacterium]
MTPEIEARLEKLNIKVLFPAKELALLGREDLMSLVSNNGSIGSTGMMTEHGFAFIVWKQGQAYMAAKGVETPATEEQVERVRQFSEDVKSAMGV